MLSALVIRHSMCAAESTWRTCCGHSQPTQSRQSSLRHRLRRFSRSTQPSTSCSHCCLNGSRSCSLRTWPTSPSRSCGAQLRCSIGRRTRAAMQGCPTGCYLCCTGRLRRPAAPVLTVLARKVVADLQEYDSFRRVCARARPPLRPCGGQSRHLFTHRITSHRKGRSPQPGLAHTLLLAV